MPCYGTTTVLPLLLFSSVVVFSSAFFFLPRDELRYKPISEEEVMRSFHHGDSGLLQSAIQSKRSLDEGCFDKEENEDGSVTFGVKDTCEFNVDDVLGEKETGKTLNDISGEYFNGKTFMVSSFKEADGKLTSINSFTEVPVNILNKFSIGGGGEQFNLDLELGGEWEKEGDNELSLESVEITISGKSRIKVDSKLLPYDIDTEIVKGTGSDEYHIKKFLFVDERVKWIDFIGTATKFIQPDGFDIFEKVGDVLSGLSGFGAFNSKQDYQYGIVAKGKMVEKLGGAKKLTILFSQSHLKGSPSITAFLEFDQTTQVFDGLTKLIGNTGIDTSFMLDKVSSKNWCVLAVTSCTTYMGPVQDHLKNCLRSEMNHLESGLHFYVEVDFKKVLEGCGNSEKELVGLQTHLPIYATINKKGVGLKLLGGVKAPFDMLIKCGNASGVLPDFLAKNVIKLTDIEMDVKEGLLKLEIEVNLPKQYDIIPGTSIKIGKLIFKAERKAGEDNTKYWDLAGSGQVVVGEANFEVSLEKTGTEYTLKLSVDQFTLPDLLNVVTVGDGASLLANEAFKGLGIKDFALEWKMGGEDGKSLNIRGRPIIFGFKNLFINAVIQYGGDKEKRSLGDNEQQLVPALKTLIRERRSLNSKFALGVYLDGADFDSIVKHFSDKEQTSLCWLNGLKAVVVISNTDGKVSNGKSRKRALAAAAKRSLSDRSLKFLSHKFTRVHKKYEKKPHVASYHHTRRRSSSNSQKIDTKRSDEEDCAEDGVELTFPTLGDDFQDTCFGTGLTFGVAWRIPETKDNCGGNNLCEWMVDNLGSDFVFTIKGTISKTQFKLEGKLKGYAILSKAEGQSELAFTSLELVIDVPSIRVEATLQYKDKTLGAWERPLIFTGSIEASPTEIKLSFSMENFIYPTPLTKYVAIGNIKLGIGYVFGTPFPSLVFGAELKLGVLDPTSTNDQAIAIRGYFGINPGNPGDNWFYGSVSKLTVAQICVAFQLDCLNVSPIFLESGFPEGITASFSKEEREEAAVGTIPEGLAVEGAINFMSFECSFDLSITTSSFNLEVMLPPVNWAGGMITVARSKDVMEKGPMAKISVDTGSGEFSIHIQGYCSFIQTIFASVNIQISSTSLKFEMEGTLIPGVLDVYVNVEASYGVADTEFSFVARLSSPVDFQRKLMKAIKESLKAVKVNVRRAINTAHRVLKRAKQKIKKAHQKVTDWQNSIDDWKETLQERKRALQEEANKSPPCDCPKVCFAFLKWNYECWQIWGHWVGCAESDPCYSMVEDVGCYIRCGLEKVVSTLVRWAKQAVLEISLLVADGVKALGNIAHGVLGIGESLLNVAQTAVDFVNKALQWALDATISFMEALLKHFALYSLEISASLSKDYTACVGYDISMLFVVNVTSSGSACLSGKGFMGSLVNSVTDGPDAPKGLKGPNGKSLSSTKDIANEAMGEIMEARKSGTELIAEERKVEHKIDDETAKDFQNEPKRDSIASLKRWKPLLDRLPKHATVRSKEEMEMYHLAHEPIPEYVSKDDPEVHGFERSPPWSVLDAHAPPVGYHAVLNRSLAQSNKNEKRSNIIDDVEDLPPCEKMKRALLDYSMITDGLLINADYLHNGIHLLLNERQKEKRFLRETKSKIQAEERNHNITSSQRESAYYLYRKAEKGFAELDTKSQIVIDKEKKFALPMVRRQLNSLLKEHTGRNFMQHTDLIHRHAMEGYKRSAIPSASQVEGEQLLDSIKAEIQSIVTNENKGLISLKNRINDVKKRIVGMTPYTERCQD